jgi:hypothetical protein
VGFRSGWVVNQCTVDTARGNIGTLTIEWEAGGTSATQPLSAGGFSLTPQELYPKIERAACFAGMYPLTLNLCNNARQLATDIGGNPIAGGNLLTNQIKAGQNIYTSADAATQLALAQLLLSKWTKGEESFYMTGWRYSYEEYSYTPAAINRGGIPGMPGGPLAASLPSDVVWLRLADHEDPAGVKGSMYKLTITWLGGPQYAGVGWWDPDIYT